MIESRIFQCTVGHQRFLPRPNSFKHGVFMLYLELDEIEKIAAQSRVFSHNKFNLFSFYESDHLIGFAGNLKTRLQALLADHKIFNYGKIFLLTYPRVLGYIFNPVSFYFIFGQDQKPLACVAEVGNTFGEMKTYVIDSSETDVFSAEFVKHFYVSPFGKLEDKFRFSLATPGQSLKLKVDTINGTSTVIATGITGRAESLNDSNLLKVFCKYPLVTLRVITLIHFHAAILWIKGLPFYLKEHRPDLQTQIQLKNQRVTRKDKSNV